MPKFFSVRIIALPCFSVIFKVSLLSFSFTGFEADPKRSSGGGNTGSFSAVSVMLVL